MMLSSVGQRGDAVRCRELGVAAYLTKPVRQSLLLDAIHEVLAALPADARTRPPWSPAIPCARPIRRGTCCWPRTTP